MAAGGEASPAPFALLARAHIERLGVSKAEFCRRTLLSEKTYERIRYGRIADRPRPETVMQVCVGLGLPLPDAEGLFVFVNKEIDISLCRFSTLRWQAPTHLPS